MMDSIGSSEMKNTGLFSSSMSSSEGNQSSILSSSTNSSSGSNFNESHSFLNSSTDYHLMKIHEGLLFTILTSTFLGALTLLTALGNLFVMTAIWMDRNLRTVQNYLIFSLAFADLMVACTVMPMGTLYEVKGEWTLGTHLCDFWTSADVLCCTASILHLVAIALDRYWSVTSIEYIQKRSPVRILTLIAVVWFLATVVSIPPIFGWKDPDFENRVKIEKRCLLSQDIGYQVFATIATFYGPLTLILLLYWKIYQVARKRIRNKPGNRSAAIHVAKSGPVKKTFNGTTTTSVSIIEPSRKRNQDGIEEADGLNMSLQGSSLSIRTLEAGKTKNGQKKTGSTVDLAEEEKEHPVEHPMGEKDETTEVERMTKMKRKESKKEGKTAKVLAIITGIFIVCWLPFFVNALIMPFCGIQCQSDISGSIFLWLGYANSLLNPVIYTIFSPDFRHAFRKMFGMKTDRRV